MGDLTLTLLKLPSTKWFIAQMSADRFIRRFIVIAAAATAAVQCEYTRHVGPIVLGSPA